MTLTYAPEHLPPGGTLIPEHLSGFVKRVRARIGLAQSLRFFGVGEYGDRTQRPHYHLIVFGLGVGYASTFKACWRFGSVDVRELSSNFCTYICGYIVKGMRGRADLRLGGRYPEFVRSSRRPGIGALAVDALVDSFTRPGGVEAIRQEGDIPYSLRRGSKLVPFDRYMRTKVREALGYEKRDFKDTACGISQAARLRLMREDLSLDEVKGSLSRTDKMGQRLSVMGRAARATWKARNPFEVVNRSL